MGERCARGAPLRREHRAVARARTGATDQLAAAASARNFEAQAGH